MDEIWRRLAWILGTGGYGAILGGVFGGVTGYIHWGSGRAAGTYLGHRLLEAFEAAGGQEYSPHKRGMIVGAADGFVFLGVVGTILGTVFAYVGRPDDEVLLYGAVGGVLLAAAAMFFGILAYAIVRNGVWAVIGLFIGGIGGAFAATLLLGVNHLLVGVVPGLVVGMMAGFLLRRYEPRLREPRVTKTVYEKWRAGDEGGADEPRDNGPDGIQKAQPSEE
jgi:hypothetical protein